MPRSPGWAMSSRTAGARSSAYGAPATAQAPRCAATSAARAGSVGGRGREGVASARLCRPAGPSSFWRRRRGRRRHARRPSPPLKPAGHLLLVATREAVSLKEGGGGVLGARRRCARHSAPPPSRCPFFIATWVMTPSHPLTAGSRHCTRKSPPNCARRQSPGAGHRKGQQQARPRPSVQVRPRGGGPAAPAVNTSALAPPSFVAAQGAPPATAAASHALNPAAPPPCLLLCAPVRLLFCAQALQAHPLERSTAGASGHCGSNAPARRAPPPPCRPCSSSIPRLPPPPRRARRPHSNLKRPCHSASAARGRARAWGELGSRSDPRLRGPSPVLPPPCRNTGLERRV
jgi:hypothetical protein